MIQTARLILRSPLAADRAALHAMWTDPAVMLNLGPIKGDAETDAAIARHAGYHPLGFWTVERIATPGLIGFAGLKPGAPDTPIDGEVEIGWMFAAAHWGRGYAQEAARAALAWGWEHTEVSHIAAITATRNAASRRVMTRLGMEYAAQDDFLHPQFDADSPLRPNVVYRIARPTAGLA